MASISNSFYSNYLNIYSSPNSANSTSYKEIQESNTQIETQSDEEILSKVQKNVGFFTATFMQSICDTDIEKSLNKNKSGFSSYMTIDTQDLHFHGQVLNKVNDYSGQKITQQEMQEAQDFLNEQMDNLMLKFYKANPEIVEDTLKGDFIFYSEGGLNRTMNVDDIEISRDYPELKYDKKVSAILFAYGARIEADRTNNEYEKFLNKAKEYLGNTEKLDEIDEKILWEIESGLFEYNASKIAATGYELFSALSNMLSPIEQEKITDSIAKVIGFYSQSNSIEINGIKVSWEPQNTNYSVNDIYSLHNKIGLMSFKVDYPQSNNLTSPHNNLLTSLASNFDTTQSIFDILNQKEKLEKENQDLKNKQAIEAYSYGNGYSNTLTSKTSKEIDSFINQMIKEAKA